MRVLIIALLAAGLPIPALAQARGWESSYSTPPFVTRRPLTDQQFLHIYRQKLTPLREEILVRTAQEGGTLSEHSRSEFQTRLDRINKDFRSFVRERRRQSIEGSGYIQAG